VELKRTQLRLLPHLTLDLPRNRATSHLPSLAAHLNALAFASVPTLPKDTLAFTRPLLTPIIIQDVLRTASGLYDLPDLERSAFNAGSAGAGGCALLLLALEAHARPPRPIPHVLVLASQLGAALGVRGAAVMARYRVLVNTIETGAARVPWLANANTPGSKHVARRSRVASAVLDVLQFREELGRAEIAEGGGPIQVDLEEDDGCDGEEGDIGRNEAELDALLAEVEQKTNRNTTIVSHGPQGSCVMARTTAAPERKFKKRRTATTQAACFLLDPLANIAPARPALAHTSYLLSSDAGVRSDTPPTRLQLLAASRGDTDAVHDDELFGEGELEGIVIGTDEEAREEREKRAQAMWMIWGEDVTNSTREDLGTGSQGNREHPGRPGGYTKKGMERVDMDKLAALLDSDDSFVALGVEEFCSGDEDKAGGECVWEGYIGGGGGEEVEGEWRPASPGFEVEWPGEW
jgi:transcription factor IIIB subunit 2